jgi:hypothetical protein
MNDNEITKCYKCNKNVIVIRSRLETLLGITLPKTVICEKCDNENPNKLEN